MEVMKVIQVLKLQPLHQNTNLFHLIFYIEVNSNQIQKRGAMFYYSSTFLCKLWLFLIVVGRCGAQIISPVSAPAPTPVSTTDPTEVAALNSILNGWGVLDASSINTTEDPCTDGAIDSTPLNAITTAIKCNCSLSGDNICHITELKVRGSRATGVISEELGNFTFLTSLDLGMNDFNGTLPSVIGNLTSLRTLRLDSLGVEVNGGIPPSFTDLKSLRTLWLSDNNFTGKFPDFFGSLTQLTDLRMQGNSFDGPIPTNIASLKNLTNLQIAELLNATDSIDFFANMSSLKNLILRNTRISGIIPNELSWTEMEFLDLSFNNLTGEIPDSLFNLSKLKYLFLGDNNLTGTLPTQKTTVLTDIDVSYNQLSGNIPSWVRDGTLNLNFIANSFNISNQDVIDSNLPAQSQCLQRPFPCRQRLNLSFGINCGRNKNISQSSFTYVEDDNNLTASSYYVFDSEWAVSNVGRFIDGPSNTYIQTTGTRFADTQNSELFQGSRLSPSSLRYYGIGLENGAYDVQLSFGEIASWVLNGVSGIRLFDIYIQGKLVEKDFDIYQEAGRKTLSAVEKNYKTNITNNFFDIHLKWSGKGTCCFPSEGTYGPSIAAISVINNSTRQIRPDSSGETNKANIGLIVGLTIPSFVLCFLLIVGLFLWRRRRTDLDDEELIGLGDIKLDTYSLTELKNATDDFNDDNLVGEGGFGPVYKGVLYDGMEVAVKKLSVASVQGKRQFVAEIATISTIQHRNLVKLHGCCYEGKQRLLVYEYMANRSLDQALFQNNDTSPHLNWSTRFKILLGTARGLMYLHEESVVRIVHRDVKASNILLDANLNPKVSDFGLAKLQDDTKSHISTGIAGTIGYLAPEYAIRGQLTEKADVFGFGIVALEVIYGRMNTDHSMGPDKTYLLEWAWRLREDGQDLKMIDPVISSSQDKDINQVSRVIAIAFHCTQTSPSRRPAMSRVVAMLMGDMEIPDTLMKPSYLMDWQHTESSDATTDTSLINK
ncbi:putative LRR receptor-like serine/threonine-protein kinase [Zostera marina]|uniref:non-specific serine/threonine protein kinase n=1 Tax=Zostera marina TaxID=29655 RepID=A0A0K9P719_ZOSMR|nr:putative LRR receptor-like serine/threonine-protein kinase [Zostera marina]